jgi:poly[(R)-3-hydroxyalkanoate] polymerase subunit PhaC
MNCSETLRGDLLPEHSALQHEHAPRPLPLFLELVRKVSERDADLARDALAGLRAYENAPRRPRPAPEPELARAGGACLRDHGGSGPPAVLIPSLINPPRILDLDEEVSLTGAVSRTGRRALLLDWGKADARSQLDVAAHVDELLLPLLRSIGEPAALIGYCLGGTMAIAAANLVECERVITLAAPWKFSHYPQSSRAALQDMWRHSRAASSELGALPMEVLQASFWSLDPERTVHKFAKFGRLDPASAETRRFVQLEDWANEGEPLPYPAARELIETMFDRDAPGSDEWRIDGRTVTDSLVVPALHVLAGNDRIAPPQTSPAGQSVSIASGHVGMIVGSARQQLYRELESFLGATE